MNWLEIGSIVLVIVLGIWGGIRLWGHIPREVGEALIALADYIEDPYPTEEKRQKLLKEWGDVLALVKQAFKK